MNIEQLLKEYYNIKLVDFKKLNGYENLNYCVTSEQGNKYVLKVHKVSDEDSVVAENEILIQLHKAFINKIPQPIISNDNRHFLKLRLEGELFGFRLLTFLEGTIWAETDVEKITDETLASFGAFMAELNLAMRPLKNGDIAARQFQWDLQYALLNEQFLEEVENPNHRKIARHFFLQFKEKVVPQLHKLRKSIIHNDANDWNVLLQNGKVSGIIDFGDVVYSQLINDVAIAGAYLTLAQQNPIETIKTFIAAYHAVLPLEEQELELLYYLIAARLCTSVCNAAYSQKRDPNNKYISVAEKPAWQVLEKWLTINPVFAENEFKKACGFSPQFIDSTEILLEKRQQYFSKAVSISYREPIQMQSAAFQYMYDAEGNTYLDAYNNIPLVGHNHPKVVAAAQQQMAQLNTNTRYLYPAMTDYAEKLLATFPPSLNKLFLVNSGSAASDLAIRLAMNFTESNQVAVMEHGYHGNTQIGIAISAYKFDGKGGQGCQDNICMLPMPDVYRGGFKGKNAGKKFAEVAGALLEEKTEDDYLAAFIAEPIIGCGGQVPLAKGYLQEMYPKVRELGGLCISDEVQTGFGRLGGYFWGFEMHGVTPDIVVLGKPMGNTHPLAAVVCRADIADAFANGMEFFSSFGGNPVSCAIGSAVLDVLEEENLQQNAFEVGNYFKQELLKLQMQNDCIGNVRGMGLFLGVEFVKDFNTKEPATQLAAYIKNELKDNFVLTSTDGPYDCVLKIKPPLCFSKKNVDEFIYKLNEILENPTIELYR